MNTKKNKCFHDTLIYEKFKTNTDILVKSLLLLLSYYYYFNDNLI